MTGTEFDVPLSLNRPVQTIDLSGRASSSLLGPADFPRQVRVELVGADDPSRQIVQIEFVYYIDPGEPRETSTHTDPSAPILHVGRFSGRIMQIDVPTPGMVRGRVTLNLDNLKPLFRQLRENALRRDPLSKPREVAHYNALEGQLMPWLEEKLSEMRA